MVRRRALSAWAACLSLGIGAVPPLRGASPARIAWISGARGDPQSPFLGAFRLGLAELGRVEERDFRLEVYWGDDAAGRLDGLVAKMLGDRPDVIVTQGPIVFNVQRSGTPLPVLFAYSGDPVEARLVESLARPGRNLSGLSMMALELVGKRLEALADAVPGLRRVALVSNPGHAGERGELAASQAAASRLGLDIRYLPFQGDAGMDGALADVLRSGCQAIVVFPDAGMMRRSERFAEFGRQNRVPAASGWAEFARRGNLLSYGPNVRQVNRRLASYVDRVLKGAAPAELPVELPTVIEHVINLRSARAMGLGVPGAALLRADELIE